jgi:hypothetical protein
VVKNVVIDLTKKEDKDAFRDKQVLKKFIAEINSQRTTDQASERSYYPAITQLIEACSYKKSN